MLLAQGLARWLAPLAAALSLPHSPLCLPLGRGRRGSRLLAARRRGTGRRHGPLRREDRLRARVQGAQADFGRMELDLAALLLSHVWSSAPTGAGSARHRSDLPLRLVDCACLLL
jgi:hypothetical protein